MKNKIHTFRVSHKFLAMIHLSSSNSYLRRLMSWLEVTVSMAAQYLMAKLSMLKVEFQQVGTSHGIIQMLRPSSFSFVSHRGSIIVDKFLIAFASARSCINAHYSNQAEFENDLPLWVSAEWEQGIAQHRAQHIGDVILTFRGGIQSVVLRHGRDVHPTWAKSITWPRH